MRFTMVILSAVLWANTYAPRAHAESGSAQSEASEKSDDAIVAAAEQLIAEGAKNQSVTPPSEAAEALKAADATAAANTSALANMSPAADAATAGEAGKKESEIPVLISDKKSAKSESHLIWRLAASLALIVTVSAAVLYASRKWRRQTDKGGQQARIEILHQFHMGPRKSLALIRVAGETMLVGITDQNINMLKSITLIDDELENAVGQNFNNFLEDEFSIADVRRALNPRA